MAPSAGTAVAPTPVTAASQTAPASAPAAKAPAVTAAPVRAIGPKLDGQISGIIDANSAYALGVSLIDLSDGVVHSYGAQDKFVAASTAKILAASAYYHLVETGRASLTAPLGASTAGAQIRQMVQQSNNDSWALILRAVGQRGITDYAASIGISYDRTVNLLTTAEMARTLQLLYTGKLLNARNTAELLSYMQNTNFETLIPPAVPAGVGVYHKYGLLFGNLHDASVLVKDGRAYVFVVYTRGRNYSDMGPRTRIIQQLTRTVTAALF
jgi:beta-lactamase class A